MLVKSANGSLNAEMIQQNLGCPGIFSEDQFHLSEYLNAPACHITQITDWRRNYVQHRP